MNDHTLATALPSELLLESLTPLKESLLCGHGFFLRGLPLRFGAENKRRTTHVHFHWHGFPYEERSSMLNRDVPSNLFVGHAGVQAYPHITLPSLKACILVDSTVLYTLPKANLAHSNLSD